MNTTTLKPPHGWVGGKSKLAKQIVSLIPEDHNLYVEVFGGALNVLYAKELPKRAKYREVVNDFNSDLINLHRCIRNHPVSLQLYINQLLISRKIFDDIKKGKLKPRNNIEKGAFFFYKLQMSFGSKGDNFAMACKSRKPKNIYKSFMAWAKRLKMVTIENMDFQKLIENYDSEEAFFYCDPPYFGTENYYKNKKTFSKDDHIRLYETLKNIKGRFLLSYNDCEFIRKLYKDYNVVKSDKILYTLGANVHKKKKSVSELFIMNY